MMLVPQARAPGQQRTTKNNQEIPSHLTSVISIIQILTKQ